MEGPKVRVEQEGLWEPQTVLEIRRERQSFLLQERNADRSVTHCICDTCRLGCHENVRFRTQNNFIRVFPEYLDFARHCGPTAAP